MKKKILMTIMIFTMMIFTACGMSEEEASAYVKASLDAAYKGEFEAFVEITDSTIEGAHAMYEENMVHTMEAAGFSDMEISDELIEKYKKLFLDISKSVDYTVGAATETENGEFEVQVEINPLLVFDDVSEEEITEAVIDRIVDMKKYPSEKKITEIAFEEMYEMLVEEIKDPKYSGEKIIHNVGVHKDDDGKYYISEEDMLALDNVFFDLENK